MIWVTPQSRLDETLSLSGAGHVVAFATDDSSFQRPTSIARDRWLTLVMNDISEPRPGLILPELSHVEAMLNFDATLGSGASLVVTCFAGISRSTAAAYIIACHRDLGGNEKTLATVLRRCAPSATPNRRLVALADDLLSRNGRMTAAIEGIGRGADAHSGTPFQLV